MRNNPNHYYDTIISDSIRYNSYSDNKLIRVLMEVDSLSSLDAGNAIVLNNLDDFNKYFPDKYLSKSLNTTKNLLDYGYGVVALNIREANNYLVSCITNNSKNYYLPLEYVNTNNTIEFDKYDDPSGYTITINLLKFIHKKYVLVTNNKTRLLLVNDGDEYIIPRSKYDDKIVIPNNISITDKYEYLKSKLISPYGYISQLNNGELTLINSNGISINTNDEGLLSHNYSFYYRAVARYVSDNAQVIINSRYKSDVSDIRILFNIYNSQYQIQVIKLSSNGIYSMNTYNSYDVDDLFSSINDMDEYIQINKGVNYNEFPIGSYDLRCYDDSINNEKVRKELDDSFYIRKLDDYINFTETDIYPFNIIYEPDLEQRSDKLQDFIIKNFTNINYPIIKLLVGRDRYYNEFKNSYNMIVDDKTYNYNGKNMSSKELYLLTIISGSTNSSNTNITIIDEGSGYKYPEHTNIIDQLQIGVYIKDPIINFNNNQHYMIPFLMMSVFNVNMSMLSILNDNSIIDLMNTINDFMDNIYYDTKLSIDNLYIDNDTCTAYVSVSVNSDRLLEIRKLIFNMEVEL